MQNDEVNESKGRMIKKIAEKFGLVMVILLMATAVLTFLAPRFGWGVNTVLSGSMEPVLKVGGVLVTRPVAAEEIEVGDVISFDSPRNGDLTSHRVTAINSGFSLSFQTKGDANEDTDPFSVPAENVVGKKAFHIPWLGYLTQFVKTRLGFLLTLCLPGIAIIGMEIRNIRRMRKEEYEI